MSAATNPHLHATRAAEQVIRDLGITKLPIDPIDIARGRQIEVMAKPASSAGVSGMLIRSGEQYGIAYATHIANFGFQHFCIAHELGHYFLPGHIEAVLADRDIHESHAGFLSADRYELEADHFAAGLLMPTQLFSAALRRAGDGLAAVEQLAALCQTSLTATAIRFTQCSREPVAILVSAGSQIDYCFMSDALRDFDGTYWIRKRQSLPRNSATFAFNRNRDNVLNALRVADDGDLQDWFGGRSFALSEDVVGLGSYQKTLTVLYGIEVPDKDEEDEESLIHSYTPRFRRR